MSENPQTSSLADDDLPDDIPLGNSDPLLVPTPLGQSFLQPKFIYPLGAVSIINPDSLNTESDFEPLSDSFNDSPFFDHPFQSNESGAPSVAASQPTLQTKSIKASPNLSSTRSPQISPQNTSIPRNSATSSPLIIPSKSPISSSFSEDTPIQRFTGVPSSSDDVTPVIGDSTASAANIESSISQEVQNNQSSSQLIQRERDNFAPDSSDTIFADNSPATTSLQESKPNTEDIDSTDNSDIPNIQSKSASQVNDRSNISKTTSKDISLNNNSPFIQRTSELSRGSQEVSNQDYRQNTQPSIPNSDIPGSVNTSLDNDVNSGFKTDISSSIQRELEIYNSESSNDSTNTFSIAKSDSSNHESQSEQSLDITDTINNNSPESIQRDVVLPANISSTNLENPLEGEPNQSNINENISNQTSKSNLVDTTNRTSNQILESDSKSVSNNEQIKTSKIQRSSDELSGVNSLNIVTPTIDQNIDLPNTIINAPSIDSSEQQLQRKSDETSDDTSTSQTISQSLQDTSNQSDLNFSSTLNTDTKTQNNYSNPESSNTSTSNSSSIINDIPTQIQTKSDLEDIPNHSSLPSDVQSDRTLELLPTKEMPVPDINPDIIANESSQSSINPSDSESHTIQRSINNQELNNTNNKISSSSFNEQPSQNNFANEPSQLIQRENDVTSTNSISDTNVSNTSIEQSQRSNSNLDISSNSSDVPITSNSGTPLNIQSKANESNQDISIDYQDEQFSNNAVLQNNTSFSNTVNNLLSRNLDLGSDVSTNDSNSYIEDISEISSTKTESTEDTSSNISQSNPDINNLGNNFNDAFTSTVQLNLQRDISDISNLENIETDSIQRDSESLASNNIDINVYETSVSVENTDNSNNNINTQIDIITDNNADSDIEKSYHPDNISNTENQNVQRQVDNAYKSNETLIANIQNDIQTDTSNISNSENIEATQVQRNLISNNIDLVNTLNTHNQPSLINQDIVSNSSSIDANSSYNNEDTNYVRNIDSKIEQANNPNALSDAFRVENQNIQRQSDPITINDSVIYSTSISPELDIQRNLLNESLPNTSSTLLDTSISNNENRNIQLETSIDSTSISELTNAQDQPITNPIASNRDDIIAPSDRLNNQVQRQTELPDGDNTNLSTDIEETDPIGMTPVILDDLLQTSQQTSPDISTTAKLDTSNTDSSYPNLQTQIDDSSLSLSAISDSNLSNTTEDINRNIVQSDFITLATDNIINRKIERLDAIDNNNVNVEWQDNNNFEQVNQSLTIQPKLDIVPSDSYFDRDLPSLQESEDRNVAEVTQSNSLQEIPQNSLDNISNEQIQRTYESSSIPSSEVAKSTSSLQSYSESSLSPTNLEVSDSDVESNTSSNSNATIDLENSLGSSEQNIHRKSDIANNIDSDRNLDVQDAIDLFGVNDRGAVVPDLPIAQASSSPPLQRKIDSSIDFNEIGSTNTKDADLSSSSHIENISADIAKNTQNIQREDDISTDASINKIDSTENIEETSKHPSITSSQDLVQTSDTSLINRKLDSSAQSLVSQDLQQISTDNITDSSLQSNSIQSRNLNAPQSNESNSSNASIKVSEKTLDHNLNTSSQVLPLNSVEDDKLVQTQRSLQENNSVVDPANTSPDVAQTIQPKLDVAASDSYLDRDLPSLRDSEHYNIAEATQSNSLEEISQNRLNDVSSDQIQRSYEPSSIPSNDVAKSTASLQPSSESSLLNEYNLSSTNSEVSNSYIESNTNNNSNATIDLENGLENREQNIQRKNDVSSLELDNAIQRQVDLDNGRADVDIASNTDSDRNFNRQDVIDSFSMNDHVVENPDFTSKITETNQAIQRAVDIPQPINAKFEGGTQEDTQDNLGTFNSNSNDIFDISSRDTTQKDITSSQNLIQTSDTSLINRKLDSSAQSLESQDLQPISSIDNNETILNDVNSQTENTIHNTPPIVANYSQDIQTPNNSDSKSIDTNNQFLTNNISADNNSQAIQAKLDIPSPDLELDSNIDNNLERSDDNNLSSISNNDLVQKSPISSKVNLEESSSVDTNVLDSHPANLQLSSQASQENIQKALDESIPSNASSKSIDISNQEIETIDTSTSLNTIQKDEIDANSQLIQRKSESIKAASTPLENLESVVQAKTENAIATRNNQSDQTVIQRLSDQENNDDLTLPTVLQNLGQTESLSNFTPLTNNQFNNQVTAQSTSTHPSQLLQAKNNSSTFGNAISDSGSNSNSINALSPTPTKIQPKADSTNQGSSPQETHAGWSNIAELLANLPPPKVSSNLSTSSLNKKSVSSSDRSSLASNPKPSPSASSQTTSSQAIIQRSPDDSADDGDLYITPAGLQRGNPNQLANSQSHTIQRKQMPSADANLPEATVKVDSRDDSGNDANFEENLNALAQEIYVLLRQRLEIEKERQGSRYQGRLPW